MTAELHHWPLTIAHGTDRGPGWTGIWQRPDTDDAAIIEEVVLSDSYHLRGLDLSPEQTNDGDRVRLVLDIGSNIGAFALTCVRMGARVIAVEPDRENVELLTRNVMENRVAHKVDIMPIAVGATRGSAFMHGGAGTAHTEHNEPDGGREVEQVTLADLLEPHTKVDLLKLDVEGAEHGIITACGHDQLAKVDRLVMELHGPAACPWMDAPRWGEIIEHLLETHAVDVFGRPSEGGGHLYARSLTAS